MISMLVRSCFCATSTKKYQVSLVAVDKYVAGSLRVVRVYADTLFLTVCFLVPRLLAKMKGNQIFKHNFQRLKLAVSAEIFLSCDCGECAPHRVRFGPRRNTPERNVVANLAFIEGFSTPSCF